MTSSSTGSAPRRQTKTLARLRDDLHLVALEHASNVVAWYDCAEELPIPDQVDDRLRDILELLFAIAAAADAERGACRCHDEGGQGYPESASRTMLTKPRWWRR